MTIIVRPAAASSITAPESYTAKLPDVPISLVAARPISVSRTISGEAAISTWDKSASGNIVPMSCLVSQATYEILRTIDDSSYDEWVLVAHGRTFRSTFDLVAATPEWRFGAQYWRVSLSFVLIEELHR